MLPDTTYYWKVLVKNVGGDSLFSTEIGQFILENGYTSAGKNTYIEMSSVRFLPGFPNPFNSEVSIKFTLSPDEAPYPLRIVIFDALGRLVCTLKDISDRAGGYHIVKWKRQDNSGYDLPNGIYLCLLQAGEFSRVQKLMLIR
jgi:hypothetical protein